MDQGCHPMFGARCGEFQSVAQLAAQLVVVMQCILGVELLQGNDMDAVWDLCYLSQELFVSVVALQSTHVVCHDSEIGRWGQCSRQR